MYSVPMFKTTIVIWSGYDVSDTELTDLAHDATGGGSYCASQTTERVKNHTRDKDWDDTEFFGVDKD